MFTRSIVCVTFATFLALPGVPLALGHTVVDFGSVSSEPVCIAKGRRLFEAYGADDIQSTSWTVTAYGLGGEKIDAALVCSYGPEGSTRVSIVIHNRGEDGDEERRRAIPDKLRPIWKDL